jgi:hypothetical protein
MSMSTSTLPSQQSSTVKLYVNVFKAYSTPPAAAFKMATIMTKQHCRNSY